MVINMINQFVVKSKGPPRVLESPKKGPRNNKKLTCIKNNNLFILINIIIYQFVSKEHF